MARKEKLLRRCKQSPKNISWEEACRLLGQYGFERKDRKGGSHDTFSHPLMEKYRNVLEPRRLYLLTLRKPPRGCVHQEDVKDMLEAIELVQSLQEMEKREG